MSICGWHVKSSNASQPSTLTGSSTLVLLRVCQQTTWEPVRNAEPRPKPAPTEHAHNIPQVGGAHGSGPLLHPHPNEVETVMPAASVSTMGALHSLPATLLQGTSIHSLPATLTQGTSIHTLPATLPQGTSVPCSSLATTQQKQTCPPISQDKVAEP